MCSTSQLWLQMDSDNSVIQGVTPAPNPVGQERGRVPRVLLPGTDLPSSWSKQFSKTHQREYWFNAADGTRTWDAPPPVATAATAAAAAVLEGPGSTMGLKGENEAEENGKAKRPRTSSHEASSAASRDDFPSLSLERARLLAECYDVFVAENSKYGEMGGASKTAKACKKDGMRVGMQGIFGRVVWTQLLKHVQAHGDIGTDASSDAVFVPSPVVDEAVLQELVEAGRSPQQAQGVMQALYARLRAACKALVHARTAAAAAAQEGAQGQERDAVSLQGKLQTDGQIYPEVTYRMACGGTSHTISGTHLQKLLRLYRTHTLRGCPPTDPTFLRRVFCVLGRYELLSGSSDGYQMAFPDVGFHWLRHRMGVTAECFASPLNCWNDRFCSVSRDTDRFFGSMGNFFHFCGLVPPSLDGPIDAQGGGSFEANPPFVESIMNEMAAKIEALLSAAGSRPLSFVVIVPAWTGCLGLETMTNSRFLRPHAQYVLRLEKKKHNYRPGMQHRTEHAEQPSNVDTLVFFLQNDAGAARWPVTVKLALDLQSTVNVL